MSRILLLLFISIFRLQNAISSSSSCYSLVQDNFIQCLNQNSPTQSPISQILYSPANSSYLPLLQSSIQNLRFFSTITPKPLFILTPLLYSHVQTAVVCCKQNGLQLTIQSGGHDYEGVSYTASGSPFVVLDLQNLRSIVVDIDQNTTWVDAGATVGELYYKIAEKSPVHGFPAGICPTVAAGGHFSGGGFGTMVRKFGLAADNVIDARVVDASGRILDRKSMGEALFWAIRGGGASSFCVVLSWKIELVHVPTTVTVFNVERTLGQDSTKLVHKWQYVSPEFDVNLLVRVVVHSPEDEVKRVGHSVSRLSVIFEGLFLGIADELVVIMEEEFPELGLNLRDCSEMSWIESVLHFSMYPRDSPLEVLVSRTPQPKSFFKAKSDFVNEPLSEYVLEKLWKWCLEEEKPILILEPFGGKMNEISESETPFPHREGNLYNIQYLVQWEDGENFKSTKKHLDWIRRVYERMTPYVSSNPRGAYLNYRDLDLGVNDFDGATYSQAKTWGFKYFKENFRRLAIVKGEVDPLNFFAYEQSVPPLFLNEAGREIE
ncbi:Xanthine dehydrogenase C subunit [Parasponia andersonii]|uniref:Xanthine dehydrogenase C subunit n=1 Tax=Parasponia andersonii TaxID=3476 RepID=A0A2P5BNE7_PARAD|nr:Xanthine dehydrogenase C subunit [Parasponia andersonii]